MRLAASPVARRLAEEHRLDLAIVQGSGPHGRIVRRDIESALKTRSVVPPNISEDKLLDPRVFYEKGSYTEITLTSMQRAIAKKLTQSMRQIPHYYISMKYDMSALLDMRHVANQKLKQREKKIKLTVNDFFIHCVALALMDAPWVNVSFADDCLLQHKHADIGIAMSLNDNGLITPIVKRAEEKSVLEIAEDIRSLRGLAQVKKLKPAQYEGGSFTVSNLGMFGVSHFTAVINPPQAAILALGGIDEDNKMEVTLSCDHRAINGAMGAQFLKLLGEIIGNPHLASI